MSSTGVNIGMPCETKNSSRVLKPPGGGHTDIFGPPEEKVLKPRAKNNQQNSASMGEIMGKTEAEGNKDNSPTQEAPVSQPKASEVSKPSVESARPVEPTGRGRVPPGGFSSGLW